MGPLIYKPIIILKSNNDDMAVKLDNTIQCNTPCQPKIIQQCKASKWNRLAIAAI